MPYFRDEFHLRRTQRIIGGKVEMRLEKSSFAANKPKHINMCFKLEEHILR